MLSLIISWAFGLCLKGLHMVVNGNRLYLFLIDIFACFFLCQTKLKSLYVALHLLELLFFNGVFAANLFKRDVILGHLF